MAAFLGAYILQTAFIMSREAGASVLNMRQEIPLPGGGIKRTGEIFLWRRRSLKSVKPTAA